MWLLCSLYAWWEVQCKTTNYITILHSFKVSDGLKSDIVSTCGNSSEKKSRSHMNTSESHVKMYNFSFGIFYSRVEKKSQSLVKVSSVTFPHVKLLVWPVACVMISQFHMWGKPATYNSRVSIFIHVWKKSQPVEKMSSSHVTYVFLSRVKILANRIMKILNSHVKL